MTKRNFIFDVRLVENTASIEDITKSYEKIAFFDEWDGKSLVPYIILNVHDFLLEVTRLAPEPVAQQYFGYWHPVSEMVVSPYKEVCMTMCCLGKELNLEKNETWNLPIDWPEIP